MRKKYQLVLVSDAPRVWIKNVLKELQIQDIFCDNIFSGEGNLRKGLGNTFANIIHTLKILPRNCIAIGDQEHTDIAPAKKLGMYTIFIHRTKRSPLADGCIISIRELPKTLKKLPDKRSQIK